MQASNIGKKIWNMAGTLRSSGMDDRSYLTQITYLLFLKMADEYSKPPHDRDIGIPADCTWSDLVDKSGTELETHYSSILETLGTQSGILGQIYFGARNEITTPAILSRVIDMINGATWSAMSSDVTGDIYEDLLEKIASDTKTKAGQYFTPRALIHTMIKCVQPAPGKTIADPCCGSGGFLLAAKSYIEDNHSANLDRNQKEFLKFKTFFGWEFVPATYLLALMNLLLHGISDFDHHPPITRGDSLLADPGQRFDYVLTNPPFGTENTHTFTNEQGLEEKEDLTYNRQDFSATTSNKQLNFVQHIKTILANTGTAAVVVPDNVLFESGAGETIRKKLLKTTNLHTILKLPEGIFYAQGVKANVIFFDNKPASDIDHHTKEVWIYDYRTGIKHTLKRKPLKEADLIDFVTCYNPGNIDDRTETYSRTNPNGRWRRFTYDEIITRDKTSLDITWIKLNEINLDEISLSDLIQDIKAGASGIEKASEQLAQLFAHIDN